MHGFIYEISRSPIRRTEWRNAFNFDNDTYPDYVDDISDSKRRTAIKILTGVLEDKAPGVFTYEKNALVYHEAAMLVFKKKLFEKIAKAVQDMSPDTSFCNMTRDMQSIINDPLDTCLRFAIDCDRSDSSYYLLIQTDYMKDGDKLYIGGIVDYHV